MWEYLENLVYLPEIYGLGIRRISKLGLVRLEGILGNYRRLDSRLSGGGEEGGSEEVGDLEEECRVLIMGRGGISKGWGMGWVLLGIYTRGCGGEGRG